MYLRVFLRFVANCCCHLLVQDVLEPENMYLCPVGRQLKQVKGDAAPKVAPEAKAGPNFMNFVKIRQKALAAIITFAIKHNVFWHVFARCQSYHVFVSPLVVRKLPEGISTKPSFFRLFLVMLCIVPLPSFKPLRAPVAKICKKH